MRHGRTVGLVGVGLLLAHCGVHSGGGGTSTTASTGSSGGGATTSSTGSSGGATTGSTSSSGGGSSSSTTGSTSSTGGASRCSTTACTSSSSTSSTGTGGSGTTGAGGLGPGGAGGYGGWGPTGDDSCGLCDPGDVLVNGVCPGSCTGCPAPPNGGVMACVSGVCTPRCPPGHVLCTPPPCTPPFDYCTTPTCADLRTNLDNCGSCGAPCPSGLCVDGICDPSLPRVLAEGSTYGPLAVDATYVYYWDTGASTIARVPKTGGTPTVLATGQTLSGTYDGLAVDDTYVYWASSSGLWKVPKGGGTVQPLASGPYYGSPASDGTYVYFFEGSTPTMMSTTYGIVRVPRTGGTPSLVVAGNSEQAYLMVDSGYAYFSYYGPGWFTARGLADGTGTVQGVLGGGPVFTFDQDYVYAGDDIGEGLARIRKDLSGTMRDVVAVPVDGPSWAAIGVDDLYAYFSLGTNPIPPLSSQSNAGYALKCGGAVSPIDPPNSPPLYGAPIVVDDSVYTVLNNQILRLPKQ